MHDTPRPSPAGQAMRILIVEDEILIAMAIEAIVGAAGHTPIAIAIDVESAREAIEAETPDLALVDVRLANGCSGIDVATLLNARGVKVLFVSGTCPEAPQPAIALGCLRKPVTERMLMAALGVVAAKLRGETPVAVPAAMTLY